MNVKTKKQLEDENAELKQQLMEKAVQISNTAASHIVAPGIEMVPIKNYGGTIVTVVDEINGQEKPIVLDTHGIKQQRKITLEKWLELERESALVKDGYIARTDQPVTNPNIIDGLDEFTKGLKEDAIRDRIAQITNANVLHRFNDYLSPKERSKTINAKELLVLAAARDRIFELTDLRIVGIDPAGE